MRKRTPEEKACLTVDFNGFGILYKMRGKWVPFTELYFDVGEAERALEKYDYEKQDKLMTQFLKKYRKTMRVVRVKLFYYINERAERL